MVSIDKIEIKDTTIVNRQYTLISSNSACFTKVLCTYKRVFSFLFSILPSVVVSLYIMCVADMGGAFVCQLPFHLGNIRFSILMYK